MILNSGGCGVPTAGSITCLKGITSTFPVAGFGIEKKGHFRTTSKKGHFGQPIASSCCMPVNFNEETDIKYVELILS